MPYIEMKNKFAFCDGLLLLDPRLAGELNYIITSICLKYIQNAEKVNYQLLNEVIGVLECAKQELYRRVVTPYEEKKKEINGDVY